MSEVQQHHVPFGHTPADGSNADQMAELTRAKGCGAAGGHTGALYQDWTVIGIDPERVGAGPPDEHISRPGAVFTESPASGSCKCGACFRGRAQQVSTGQNRRASLLA